MKDVVSGVLLLDKPADISSHSALAKAKFLLKSPTTDSKKAGHTGTLDPMATGLLPLCFGEATKFSQYGLDADKGYEAIIKLGAASDSGDKDGQITAAADVPEFDDEILAVVARKLTGAQNQIPPMYSALKKDGKKLYEYARAGIEVERAPRPIRIETLTLKKRSADEIALSVRCSKGTYVRVLGEDVAKQLGTLGHLTTLRRTQTGGFSLAQAVSLAQFEAMEFHERMAQLLPIDVLMAHLPILPVSAQEAARLRQGQRLNAKDRLANFTFDDAAQAVRLYADDAFVGLGMLEPNGRLQPKKLVV
ncbi:tRNA pseudouridine(55) synthase TruB [Moraxella caviae]|uniref:tRNA pseudouridine synthase B n=1 Tax=Moraxella caviae TaxID=34060 RepID=A0A1T0A9D3_9GAMM|nr:tRNA pseudouridine(55) synthase TruB [Moraxella caviae]OOR92347.1 tRNA pseudouridine(55) synthase TruB [Moraxella caviae]STZ10590.1 tRNA pseudouridine synthase B [Moraxella caviae]VEW10947.1 tRNA pseudouridine synthase B [Moraxella caviae]